MSATGNVKISELVSHSSIDGREQVPLSWEQVAGGGFESYKMTVDNLKTYIGTALGITGTGGIQTYLNSYGKQISYLDRDLGQYAGGLDGNFCEKHSKNLSVASSNKAIGLNGTEITKSGYAISNPVDVSEGTVYLLKLDGASSIPTDVVIFSKRHTHTYYVITGYEDKEVTITNEDGTTETITVREPIYGGTQTDVVYEPYSSHYAAYGSGGYGKPASGYVIFYAIEDEQIIISAPTSDISGKKLYAVHYALFDEIAEKFIGTKSDISRVIAEAITGVEKRVKALEENVFTIGDDISDSIDAMSMYKYRGHDIIVQSTYAPSSTAKTATITYNGTSISYTYAPADLPNHKGQIWVSDYDENNAANPSAWIAVKQDAFGGWKKMSLS